MLVTWRPQDLAATGAKACMMLRLFDRRCYKFRELTDKMGLERVQLGGDSNEVSIWDGQAFVFNESAWSLVTLYRMIRRCLDCWTAILIQSAMTLMQYLAVMR